VSRASRPKAAGAAPRLQRLSFPAQMRPAVQQAVSRESAGGARAPRQARQQESQVIAHKDGQAPHQAVAYRDGEEDFPP